MRDLDFCQFPSKEQKKESYLALLAIPSLSFFCGKVSFSGSLQGDSALGFLLLGAKCNGAKGHGNSGKQKGGNELWGQHINVAFGAKLFVHGSNSCFLNRIRFLHKTKNIDLEYGP